MPKLLTRIDDDYFSIINDSIEEILSCDLEKLDVETWFFTTENNTKLPIRYALPIPETEMSFDVQPADRLTRLEQLLAAHPTNDELLSALP